MYRCGYRNPSEQRAGTKRHAVLGIGGGRVLDCAKAVANLLSHVGLVTIPTVAATCAAWSPVSIIYNELGGHVRSQPLSRMPLMLLVARM